VRALCKRNYKHVLAGHLSKRKINVLSFLTSTIIFLAPRVRSMARRCCQINQGYGGHLDSETAPKAVVLLHL